MDYEVIEKEGTTLKIRFKDIDQGFLNLIKAQLWKDPAVDISGFRVTHPIVGVAEFTLKTNKKQAKAVWNNAITNLEKKFDGFQKDLKKIE